VDGFPELAEAGEFIRGDGRFLGRDACFDRPTRDVVGRGQELFGHVSPPFERAGEVQGEIPADEHEGMCAIVTGLGDDLANRKPSLEGANSP